MSKAGFNPFEASNHNDDVQELSASDAQLIDETIALAQQAANQEIPNFVDTVGLSNAKNGGKVDNVVAGMLQAASQAKSDIEGRLLQKQLTGGDASMGIGGLVAGSTLFTPEIFNESLASLKTGNFAGIQHKMDEIVMSARGVLNALEASPDGSKFNNYAGLQKEPLVPDISESRLMALASPTVGTAQQIGQSLRIS